MASDADLQETATAAILSPLAARLAVSAAFFINGAVFAVWAPQIPAVQARLHLTPGGLGLTLLGAALGAVLIMPPAGAITARFGARTVISTAALLFCALLPLVFMAPSAPVLFLTLAAFGASAAAMDVSMNTAGVAVEDAMGAPVMSSLHGLFSLGALCGALAATAAAVMAIPTEPFLLGAALLPAAAILVARPALPAARADGSPAFAPITRPLLALAIICFCAFLAEGSVADWSAVYLRRTLGAAAALGAAGYAAFQLTMTCARLLGDRVTSALGPVRLVRLGCLLAAAGLALALLIPVPAAAVVGFAAMGVGLANVVPILFSAGGRTPGVAAGPGIAAVATAGYLGMLAGPPAIGFTADAVTVRGGLALVVALSLVGALLAPAARHATRADPEDVAILQ